MIKVLQYGEGNFLRAFADNYFNELNKEGGHYEVTIVKPITYGTLDKFHDQKNIYHVVKRGVKFNTPSEEVKEITVLADAISPFEEYEKYMSLASDKGLKIIVSNTTEAGICYNETDTFNGFENITYPAKLTKFLYARWQSGCDGLYLMPVELIDNNADNLKLCVDKYITLWNLDKAFKKWNDENNYYCNTLVDRIVSGYPKDEETLKHCEDLIGKKDSLMTICEPFGLWAVEKKGEIDKYIKEGHHEIDVVLTNNIAYYKKRKVRVLNGSHTNIVPCGLMLGAVTVYDCLTDEKLSKFLLDTLKNEINEFVGPDINETEKFSNSVKERFLNPYLNHQLTSIALNSISKWRARILPTFTDYYNKYGKIPKNLTIGFSYLMAMYSSAEKRENSYFVKVPNREIELKDDVKYLEYFQKGGDVSSFMQDNTIFGENLDNYKDFTKTVLSNIEKIKKGESLL